MFSLILHSDRHFPLAREYMKKKPVCQANGVKSALDSCLVVFWDFEIISAAAFIRKASLSDWDVLPLSEEFSVPLHIALSAISAKKAEG